MVWGLHTDRWCSAQRLGPRPARQRSLRATWTCQSRAGRAPRSAARPGPASTWKLKEASIQRMPVACSDVLRAMCCDSLCVVHLHIHVGEHGLPGITHGQLRLRVADWAVTATGRVQRPTLHRIRVGGWFGGFGRRTGHDSVGCGRATVGCQVSASDPAQQGGGRESAGGGGEVVEQRGANHVLTDSSAGQRGDTRDEEVWSGPFRRHDSSDPFRKGRGGTRFQQPARHQPEFAMLQQTSARCGGRVLWPMDAASRELCTWQSGWFLFALRNRPSKRHSSQRSPCVQTAKAVTQHTLQAVTKSFSSFRCIQRQPHAIGQVRLHARGAGEPVRVPDGQEVLVRLLVRHQEVGKPRHRHLRHDVGALSGLAMSDRSFGAHASEPSPTFHSLAALGKVAQRALLRSQARAVWSNDRGLGPPSCSGPSRTPPAR